MCPKSGTRKAALQPARKDKQGERSWRGASMSAALQPAREKKKKEKKKKNERS
jgi:hypothetical protein